MRTRGAPRTRGGRRARDVHVVSNPEFLREGHAVEEFLHPHRVVIGADDEAAAARVAELYGGIDAPIVVTDSRSAELIKYASNAYLATKISFVNELANVCDPLSASTSAPSRPCPIRTPPAPGPACSWC